MAWLKKYRRLGHDATRLGLCFVVPTSFGLSTQLLVNLSYGDTLEIRNAGGNVPPGEPTDDQDFFGKNLSSSICSRAGPYCASMLVNSVNSHAGTAPA